MSFLRWVAPHVTAATKTGDTKGIYSPASLESLSAAVHQLVMRQYALHNDVLSPSFAAQIHRASRERSAVQRRWVQELLSKRGTSSADSGGFPAHPFPANKS